MNKRMGRFYDVCRRRMLKENASRIKTLVFERDERSECRISLNGEELESVDDANRMMLIGICLIFYIHF